MILGLRTVIYPVTDLARGKAWYADVLGVAPYFDQPFYVGFAVGGFELGLIPDGTPGPDGSTVREAPHDVGEGIKVASVADPFGNTFAIIENPHFSTAAVR
jgi:catechol 2,3-dioxygenase-like lactoylglutathione lyase family enzyme